MVKATYAHASPQEMSARVHEQSQKEMVKLLQDYEVVIDMSKTQADLLLELTEWIEETRGLTFGESTSFNKFSTKLRAII